MNRTIPFAIILISVIFSGTHIHSQGRQSRNRAEKTLLESFKGDTLPLKDSVRMFEQKLAAEELRQKQLKFTNDSLRFLRDLYLNKRTMLCEDLLFRFVMLPYVEETIDEEDREAFRDLANHILRNCSFSEEFLKTGEFGRAYNDVRRYATQKTEQRV